MADEGPRGLHRHALLAALALVPLLLGACGPAKPGDPALPDGFAKLGLPPVNVNAMVYLNSGSPVAVPPTIFGVASASEDDLRVLTVEGLVNDPEGQIAVRAESVDQASADRIAEVANRFARGSDETWMDADGAFVAIGTTRDEWSATLRPAWINGKRETIEERYPLIWSSLRLLPEEPPAPPVAAGFVRNVTDLLDQLLENNDLTSAGLSDAFGLIRVEALGFAVYTDEISDIPDSVGLSMLRELDAGLIAASEAGYPGTVVDFLYERFAERAALETVALGGEAVQYRSMGNDLHMIVKNYGSSFFFTFSQTKQGVEELIKSVIKSQESR